VTSPLFYVNSSPHIGHAYSAVLADALSRWEGARLVVGTDEHGQKISTAAKDRGKDTLAFCNEISESFRSTFDVLSVKYDYLIRTTEARHAETVRALWSRIRPAIELGNHEGWYCASDEAFVPAGSVDEATKTLKDGPRHTVEWVSEPNYRFRYDPLKLKDELERRCHILPGTSRKNEVLSMLQQNPAEQLISVSRPRSRVPWAIAVPDDPTQSIYVWVDALTGYITGSGSILNPDPTQPAFIENHFENVTHIVGKDILKFHCVHWPAFLMAAGIPIPERVIAHAHWTVNRTKMSKSLKNVVCPNDLLQNKCKGQVDVLRYFLLRDGRLEDDADFSESALIERCDGDLADNLGNLLSRACAESMWGPLNKFTTSVRPTEDQTRKRKDLVHKVDILYRQADFGRGLELLMRFLDEANADFSAREPWKDAKVLKKDVLTVDQRKQHEDKLGECLGNALDACRTAAILLSPVTPKMSKDILVRLQLHVSEIGDIVDYGMQDIRYRIPSLTGPVLVQKLAAPAFTVKKAGK